MLRLVVAFGVLSLLPVISTPWASTEIPEHACPEHKQEFYLCERQREQCDRESRKSNGCGMEQANCIRKIPVSNRDCENVAEHKVKQAKLEHPNGILTEEMVNEQVETEVIMPLDGVYSLIKKHCFGGDDAFQKPIDLLSNGLKNATQFTKKVLHVLVIQEFEINSSTSAKCNSSISALQRALKVLDEITTTSLRFPYSLWRCGWQTDDLGMVLVRKAAQITSRYDAEKFNHCCAIHMDCYSSQMGREDCDRKFEDCGKKTVDSSVGSKHGNEMFKNILNDLVNLTSQDAYKNAGQLKTAEVNFETYGYHYESQYDGFRPDPLNKKERYIVYVSLGEDFKKYDRQKFRNVYWECLNNWAAVSSCGHLAQICIENKDLDSLGCTFQLDECLSQVCPNADKCKENIPEIKKRYKYYSESLIFKLIIAIDVLYCLFYLPWRLCKTIWDVIRNENHWIRRAWRWTTGMFGRMATTIMGLFGQRGEEMFEMPERQPMNRGN